MITPEEARIFLAAALLHDIGHYPFAHLVDRLPDPITGGMAFDSHEDRANAYILGDRKPGSIYSILQDEWGISDPERVAEVIAEPRTSGLPGKMLSGILDPDKMDYLMRDAWGCGVPYGNIDTDRLIESLVVDAGRLGITEKGVAPLESLIFAKYMMFRHIYWHHAVRIAFAMLTRFVQDSLDAGTVHPEDFYRLSDDSLVENLASMSAKVPSAPLIRDMQSRRLYKRGLTLYPEHAVGEAEFAITGRELESVKELYRSPVLRCEKEIAICRMLGTAEKLDLRGHEVLLDIPRISSVFDLDDFGELRVLVTPQSGDKDVFLPFNSQGFSQLTAGFAQEFERYSRRVQVICRPDIREAVRRHADEIRTLVTAD
jgi:HD superfamily phosphohydrolase